MIMSKEEILKSFEEARQPVKQVQILADMNACKASEIVKILKEMGVDGRRLPRTFEKPLRNANTGVLAAMMEEARKLEARAADVDRMIEELEKEKPILAKKMEAVAAAIELMKGVYQ